MPAAHSRRHPVFDLRGRRARSRPARNHRLVTELVERELRREGLPPATFGNLRAQELILAETADRSVLGCMNDMASFVRWPSAMLVPWQILTSAS